MPLAASVSPASRSASAQINTAAPKDSATVTLTGDGAASATWSATKKKAWTTLTTGSGTGNGKVRWNRSSTGLAVGTYVDTITITAGAATTKVIDTLVITAAPVPLAASVSPASRSASVQINTAAPKDSATVTLTGDGAASATWSATKKKAWTTLTTGSGTGNGKVRWNRSSTGLAVGTYVDTITITAGAATTKVIDTLIITAAPVPLAASVSPASRSASAQINTAAPKDSATVTLTGDGAASATWSATKKKAWTTLTTGSGTGSGKVRWNRSSTGLAVGTYVDTITITAGAATTKVIDTLIITAAPVPLAMGVTPASRKALAQIGTAAPGDVAAVTITGEGAATAVWTATKKQAWTTLTTSSGVGNGQVSWTRNTAGLAVGTWVDTITVTAVGIAGPKLVIDTLVITAAPVPLVAAISPGSARTSVQLGTAAPGGTATVTLTGDGAAAAGWGATNRKPWSTLTTNSGTGNGQVVWTRNSAGLAVGTHVDTITVASGAAIAHLIDTLIITAPPVPITVAVSPMNRSTSAQINTAAPQDSATVTLTGDGAASAAWTATKQQTWTTLTTASGTGNGRIRWQRNTGGLAVGTWVDTITITAGSATTRVIDTLVILPAPVSPPPPPPAPKAISISPRGRTWRMVFATGFFSLASADAVRDSVMVQGDGSSEMAAMTWEATSTARIKIVTATGLVGSRVVWERVPTLLAVGTHIDSVKVRLIGHESEAWFVDTLVIAQVSAPTPTVAVTQLLKGTGLNTDQQLLLDQVGNRNGRYDLGDFLAWVDRGGVAVSPAMMQQLMTLPEAGGDPGVGATGRSPVDTDRRWP